MNKQEYDRKRHADRYHNDDRFYLRKKLSAMLWRCKTLPYYKGLKIHQEWLDNPDSFIEWALNNGWKRGLEIDRIDSTKGYSPDNCRFVTRKVNARNRQYATTDFEKGTRKCSQCGIVKSLSDFHRGGKAGRRYNCKECNNKKRREERKILSPGAQRQSWLVA